MDGLDGEIVVLRQSRAVVSNKHTNGPSQQHLATIAETSSHRFQEDFSLPCARPTSEGDNAACPFVLTQHCVHEGSQEGLLLFRPEEGWRLSDAFGFPMLWIDVARLCALQQELTSSSSSTERAHAILRQAPKHVFQDQVNEVWQVIFDERMLENCPKMSCADGVVLLVGQDQLCFTNARKGGQGKGTNEDVEELEREDHRDSAPFALSSTHNVSASHLQVIHLS